MKTPKVCENCNDTYEVGHSQRHPKVAVCGCACGISFFDEIEGVWIKE